MPSQIWHSSGRPQKAAAWNSCKNVKWSHEKNSVYDDTICRDLDGYGDVAVYRRKNAHGQQPVFAADCRRFAVDFLLGNTAQSPPDGFARNLRADFPSYCRKIWQRTLRTSFVRCCPCNFSAFVVQWKWSAGTPCTAAEMIWQGCRWKEHTELQCTSAPEISDFVRKKPW